MYILLTKRNFADLFWADAGGKIAELVATVGVLDFYSIWLPMRRASPQAKPKGSLNSFLSKDCRQNEKLQGCRRLDTRVMAAMGGFDESFYGTRVKTK